jgi:hypothetical protein
VDPSLASAAPGPQRLCVNGDSVHHRDQRRLRPVADLEACCVTDDTALAWTHRWPRLHRDRNGSASTETRLTTGTNAGFGLWRIWRRAASLTTRRSRGPTAGKACTGTTTALSHLMHSISRTHASFGWRDPIGAALTDARRKEDRCFGVGCRVRSEPGSASATWTGPWEPIRPSAFGPVAGTANLEPSRRSPLVATCLSRAELPCTPGARRTAEST